MAGTKTLHEPNRNDPLSEPNVGRRLWAAYLRAGYTRTTFAAAIGVDRNGKPPTYQTVFRWDKGGSPDLHTLARAAQLVGYSMDELYYGHRRPMMKRIEDNLTGDQIIALLGELRADDDAASALGEYRVSPAGMFTKITRVYVEKFVEGYTAIAARTTRREAIAIAAQAGRDARVLAEAMARGVKPVSRERLEQVGDEIRKGVAATRRAKT